MPPPPLSKYPKKYIYCIPSKRVAFVPDVEFIVCYVGDVDIETSLCSTIRKIKARKEDIKLVVNFYKVRIATLQFWKRKCLEL